MQVEKRKEKIANRMWENEYLVDVLIELWMNECMSEEDTWFGSTHWRLEIGVERRGMCEFWNSRVFVFMEILFLLRGSSPTSVREREEEGKGILSLSMILIKFFHIVKKKLSFFILSKKKLSICLTQPKVFIFKFI
jgi:hypothetical protein